MRVLDVGGEVFLLRFLPDGRRLFVATVDPIRNVHFALVPLIGGEPIPLSVPGSTTDSWYYNGACGNVVGLSPGGDMCYLAWDGTLHAFRTTDGKALPLPKSIRAHQVVVSPGGDRLLAAFRHDQVRTLYAVRTGPKRAVEWKKEMPLEFTQLAGLLPDGERFVTVDRNVRVWSLASGDELTASRHKQNGCDQPQITTDGRYLGMLGYGNMYVWDLTTLEKPRKIGGSSNFGDFRSLAFHPDNRRMAVIHGGPTLVKVYDLTTLKRVQTWKWKLGPLRSVAYSPDGTLGAAGSVGGQVVVWDEDA